MSYPLYNQQQYMPQAVPTASCGAVSINIMNPTTGMTNPMGPSYQNALYQYPVANYYGNQPMQMPYPANYNNNINTNTSSPLNSVAKDNNNPVPPAPTVESSKTANENKTDKEDETKEKIPLTDYYIKTLENYLNSQDSKVRLMGAKDVLERFKEDSSRKNDAALTALLNKILQDPNSAVRFLGLTTLDAGYALGNEQTIELLKAIQSDGQKEYGEDSLLASQILLRLSAGEKVKFTPENTDKKQDTNEVNSEEAKQ